MRCCQVRGIEEMLRVLKGLPDRFAVCYEASCGYGHYPARPSRGPVHFVRKVCRLPFVRPLFSRRRG